MVRRMSHPCPITVGSGTINILVLITHKPLGRQPDTGRDETTLFSQNISTRLICCLLTSFPCGKGFQYCEVHIDWYCEHLNTTNVEV